MVRVTGGFQSLNCQHRIWVVFVFFQHVLLLKGPPHSPTYLDAFTPTPTPPSFTHPTHPPAHSALPVPPPSLPAPPFSVYTHTHTPGALIRSSSLSTSHSQGRMDWCWCRPALTIQRATSAEQPCSDDSASATLTC